MEDKLAPTPHPRRFLSLTVLLRAIAFLGVYGAAVYGFSAGVGASERNLLPMGLAEHAYYALGLFVLGGLDIGTPVGGPPIARALLWIAYFAAPLTTAFAIIETAIRLFRPLGFRIRPLSDHVVVAGGGRLAVQYVRRLRATDSRRTIVVVEKELQGPHLTELKRGLRATVVNGDVSSDRVLDELRLPHAHRVVLLTSDDFVNLDAAAKIARRAPTLSGRIVAHVSDLRFMQETAGSSVSRDCEVFNGHEFAARTLVNGQLLNHFQDTEGRDPIVLAGFGRFGRTVLDQLQMLAPESFGPVVIIDHDGQRNARVFERDPGFLDSLDHHVIDGDVLDPDVWRRVSEITGEISVPPVFILGSGGDGINLQAALTVRRDYPDAYIVVRGFRASPFREEVAREAGLHAVHLGRLVRDGMPDHWFG